MTAASVVPQHMEALEKANGVRKARKALRDDLKSLPTEEAKGVAAAVIADPDEWLETLPVDVLLCWIRRWGQGHALRLLVAARVVPVTRPVGRLTDRQRDVLCAVLRGEEGE